MQKYVHFERKLNSRNVQVLLMNFTDEIGGTPKKYLSKYEEKNRFYFYDWLIWMYDIT